MKKRIVSVILVLAITLSLLCGCGTLFVLDAENDYNQILATINYNGMMDYVKKGEVSALMNSTGYYYVTQNGYTVEDTITMLTESLAKRKLLILKAEEYYIEEYNKGNDTKLDKTNLDSEIIYNKLLTRAEYKKAIEKANETLQTSYDEILKELEKDELLNKGETSSTADDSSTSTEDDTKFRPVPPEDEEDFDRNAVVETMPKYFTDSENWTNKTKLEQRAYNKLLKNLNSNYLSYDYYLKSEAEQIILDNYKDYISKVGELDALVEEVYNDLLKKNKIAFASKTDYETALTNEEIIAYHNVYKDDSNNLLKYGYVKNILLKFDSDLENELKNFTETGVNNDSSVTEFRESLAERISVPISNLKYNENSSESHDCMAKHTHTGSKSSCKYHVCDNNECPLSPYVWKLTINGQTFYPDDLDGKSEDKILESLRNGTFESNLKFGIDKVMNMLAIDLNAATDTDGKIEVMEKWVYLVSDDTGMFADDNTLKNYLIVPEGSKSSWVQEFTDLGRALVDGGVGCYSISDAKADQLKGCYVYEEAATGERIAYCITEYGVHIMVLSKLPYDYSLVGADVTEYNDASVKEKILENIKKDYETQYYYDFQKNFLNNETLKELISYNKDVKKQIISETNKLLGK